MLDFARCMREHGVDMPDPKFEGGRVTMQRRPAEGRPGRRCAPPRRRARKYRDAIKPPELSDAEKAEFKKAALAQRALHARARDRDFPDPTFDENGGAQIRIERGQRASNPESAKFKAAEKACRDTLPGGRRRRTTRTRMKRAGSPLAALAARPGCGAAPAAASPVARRRPTARDDRDRRAARPRRPRDLVGHARLRRRRRRSAAGVAGALTALREPGVDDHPRPLAVLRQRRAGRVPALRRAAGLARLRRPA